MKHHELLWGSAIVAFIAWILFASSPMVRISRTCRPLRWGSNGLVSLTALTAPKFEKSMQNGGNRVVYGCEYSLWRLFYQKQYDAYLAAQHGLPANGREKLCPKGKSGPAGQGGRAACTPAHVIVSRPARGAGL